MASCARRARGRRPEPLHELELDVVQAIAIAPVAAGAATGTTWPMPSGRSSATSRAISRPASRRSRGRSVRSEGVRRSRHSAEPRRVPRCREGTGPRGADRRVDGGGPRGPVEAADEVGAQHADLVPVEGRPGPMRASHQSPAASADPGEGVDDEHLWRVDAETRCTYCPLRATGARHPRPHRGRPTRPATGGSPSSAQAGPSTRTRSACCAPTSSAASTGPRGPPPSTRRRCRAARPSRPSRHATRHGRCGGSRTPSASDASPS